MRNMENKKPESKQQITVEYAGMVITVPIMLTSVTARDLELQKRAFMNAAEEAFFEYLYVNRLGRYSMIPKEDAKASTQGEIKDDKQPVPPKSSEPASPSIPDNPKK